MLILFTRPKAQPPPETPKPPTTDGHLTLKPGEVLIVRDGILTAAPIKDVGHLHRRMVIIAYEDEADCKAFDESMKAWLERRAI